jgi:predicted nucleic acid-binding protein
MILVDTSIWIDHFRQGSEHLARLLRQGQVITHPQIIGELALGNLQNRQAVLDGLSNLARAIVASDDEVLRLIETKAIYGRGIGYIDAHLLAAILLTPGSKLWTRDKCLLALSNELGLAYPDAH